MAELFVQQNSSSWPNSTAPRVCAYATNTVLNNLLVVFVGTNNAGITVGITDSQGNIVTVHRFFFGAAD